MSEYEYEVTFRGSQWTTSVLIYHEADSYEGEDERDRIQAWAEAVLANQGGALGDYHEVSIEKTGKLL